MTKSGFLCTYNNGFYKSAKLELLMALKIIQLKLLNEEETDIPKKEKFVIKELKNIKNIILIENKTSKDIMRCFELLTKNSFNKIQRIFPIQSFFSENTKLNIKNFVEEKEITESFKIFYKERCSDLFLKEFVFQTIIKKFENVKVDLTKPKYIFLVQVVKNFVCLTLLENKGEEVESFNFSKDE